MATAKEIHLYGHVLAAAHHAASKVSNVAILASAATRHCRFVVTMTTTDTDHEKNILDVAQDDSNTAIVTLRGVWSANTDPAPILDTAKAALKVAKAAFMTADKACKVIPDSSETVLEKVRANIQRARDAYPGAIAAIECAEAAREDTRETDREIAREEEKKKARENEMTVYRKAVADLWEEAENARLADRQEFQRILRKVTTEKEQLERHLSEANATAESGKEQLQRQLNEAKSENEQLQRQIQELQRQTADKSVQCDSLALATEVPLGVHFPDQMASEDSWSLVDEVAVFNAQLEDKKRQLRLKKMREEIDSVDEKLTDCA